MARPKGFTKADKISACKAYQNGTGSLRSIAYDIGCSKNTFKRWYQRYAVHGESAFDEVNSLGRYSLEFKQEVINYYLVSPESAEIVSAKYNIPYSTLRVWIKMYSNSIEFKNDKPKGDTTAMKSRETSFDERLEIVKWIINNSMNYKAAANKYGISYSALHGWTKRYLNEGESALRYKRRGRKVKVDISNLSEVELLKHRLQEETSKRKRAELELQILKKKEEFGSVDYFNASLPNEKWLTDVTEFKVVGKKQKLYLSAILDLYDRTIVAYEMSLKNDVNLVFNTFDKAISSNPKATPIFHSDRGFQYTSKKFQFRLNSQDMIQSMSRAGKCLDNAPMESFWGTLKSEMYYLYRFHSLDNLKAMVEDYIEFYNNNRFQEKLNCLCPMEYRVQAIN